MPLLSVIIPTHNRANILEKCLTHLESQTIAEDIEVIVINDVQNDKEYERIANSAWQIPVSFETISPCHQGVARNKGVQKARSSTLLFIGDDILLAPDACALHVEAHEHASTPIAVLGSIEWAHDIEVTAVMKWLMQSGWQFGYPKIQKYAGGILPKNMQHQYSYTANISLPTEVAERISFRDDIALYGWEDVEWGNRLKNAGVRVYFESKSLGFHHHVITMEDSLRRMETIGKAAVVLAKAVPEFDRLPRGWKKMAYSVAALLPTMAGRHRKAFLRGINKL
ncbi:MAG: glycosyltransferase family 2 protein [Candidatus Peribacter sp.]|jgi:glycosyltransferase involved in cell wall biosynthesis|nr:glycosyltransferase family 2 protein [Candidatus Peribacter sp.]MBT4393115.1 glycosyltransferase family 2 protein [Candidatus Peribacter sp.]MBT4600914.1 glycosyltransferase family 2 protein [Candidatus Peribacter sp.]MBT5148956.1 glycosyltransferase family 2 protein [Candidatus Peribacter sp.]MBT5638365.1 glycosyltransferase family 2 protein [Candidatus Peribacter sp.]